MYEHEPTGGIPRWAKIVGIVVAVVALLVIIMMLIGGPGGHGPGRHMGGAPASTQRYTEE